MRLQTTITVLDCSSKDYKKLQLMSFSDLVEALKSLSIEEK